MRDYNSKDTHRDLVFNPCTLDQMLLGDKSEQLFKQQSVNITQRGVVMFWPSTHTTQFLGAANIPTTGLACKPQRFNFFIANPCQWRSHLQQCRQRVELFDEVKWQNSCCVSMNKACLVCCFITFRKKTFHWAKATEKHPFSQAADIAIQISTTITRKHLHKLVDYHVFQAIQHASKRGTTLKPVTICCRHWHADNGFETGRALSSRCCVTAWKCAINHCGAVNCNISDKQRVWHFIVHIWQLCCKHVSKLAGMGSSFHVFGRRIVNHLNPLVHRSYLIKI